MTSPRTSLVLLTLCGVLTAPLPWASAALSPDDILVRCTPSPTQSATINQSFGGYQVEFKVRQAAENLPEQVRLMNDYPYNVTYEDGHLHQKNNFNQAFTSRLLNKNYTPSDVDPTRDTLKNVLTEQETQLLNTNPLALNAIHFVNLHSNLNGKSVDRKARQKTSEWILDQDYLSDTQVAQRHSALFDGPTYLIPLVGILASSNQHSSSLLINVVGYLGIGVGALLLKQVIYQKHWEKSVRVALNYDGDFHIDPVSLGGVPDADGYINYRASLLILGAGNKPVLDFRTPLPGSDHPLQLHYALACDGSFEQPKSGLPIAAFRAFTQPKP